jgi:hypothetical protein
LKKIINFLERKIAENEIKYVAGEISEQKYKLDNEDLKLGLGRFKQETENLFMDPVISSQKSKDEIRNILYRTSKEHSFFFYYGYDQYTGKYARNIKEFVDILQHIKPSALRFHLERGDFQTWFRDLSDPSLASSFDALNNLVIIDEELKNRIVECVKRKIRLLEKILSLPS